MLGFRPLGEGPEVGVHADVSNPRRRRGLGREVLSSSVCASLREVQLSSMYVYLARVLPMRPSRHRKKCSPWRHNDGLKVRNWRVWSKSWEDLAACFVCKTTVVHNVADEGASRGSVGVRADVSNAHGSVMVNHLHQLQLVY